jgi:glycosyltransferase involved in cell wall biosynthesis
MIITNKTKIVYLGYNHMLKHKRGVENVIDFQSRASLSICNYYIHWDDETKAYRYQNLICIGIEKNIFWFLRLNIILHIIKRRDGEIFIHSHNPLMSIMSFYRSNLFTIHDALYYLASATKHKLNKVFYLLEKFLYLRINYVHFISNYSKKMSLIDGNKNCSIIPNTSHLEAFATDNIPESNRTKTLAKVTKIFIVRSIEERALINLIIDVADKLKTEKIEFFIAGKGPLLVFYRDKIKELGLENIALLGYVNDDCLIQYYQDCDLVLVSAAYGEGFGLPIIEGYLYNKPVIASNVCAIPEVIISSDFLFDNTVDSVISKIYFARDQKEVKYRNYYDELFSNAAVISKMNKLYKTLC